MTTATMSENSKNLSIARVVLQLDVRISKGMHASHSTQC